MTFVLQTSLILVYRVMLDSIYMCPLKIQFYMKHIHEFVTIPCLLCCTALMSQLPKDMQKCRLGPYKQGCRSSWQTMVLLLFPLYFGGHFCVFINISEAFFLLKISGYLFMAIVLLIYVFFSGNFVLDWNIGFVKYCLFPCLSKAPLA